MFYNHGLRLFVGAVCCLAAVPAAHSGTARASEMPQQNPFADAMSRVFLNYSGQADEKAQFSAETIQPLFDAGNSTLFVQGRAAYANEDWTLNGGLGYRYLLPERNWLLGTSVWWDGTTEEQHRRWGLGGEAIGQVLTVRGNYYDAYSDWRVIEDTETFTVEEKAMDGFDASLESQLPYMPWLRLEAGYYQWDVTTEGNDDVQGFMGRAQLDLTSYTRLEGTYSKDNYDERFGVKMSVALGAPRDVEFSALETGLTSDAAFSARDLDRQRLARVQRHNDIMVERRTTNKAPATVTVNAVTIGRSN